MTSSFSPDSYNGTHVVIVEMATTFTYALSKPRQLHRRWFDRLGQRRRRLAQGHADGASHYGVAAFPGLSISQVVSGPLRRCRADYTLTAGTAGDGGLTSLPSAAFNTTLSSPA